MLFAEMPKDGTVDWRSKIYTNPDVTNTGPTASGFNTQLKFNQTEYLKHKHETSISQEPIH